MFAIDTALFLGGVLGGSLAKTATAPFDRIAKVKQTGDASYRGLNYHTIVRRITEETGVLGMWKGNLTNCLRAGPTKGILFFTNEKSRGMTQYLLGVSRAGDEFIAGAIAGTVSTVVMFPVDSVQVRLAGTKHAQGLIQTSLKIARQGRYFEGLGPTLFGTVFYYSLKFGLYRNAEEYLVENYKPAGERLTVGEKALCGAGAALSANVLLYWNNSPRQIRKTQGEIGVPKANNYIEAVKIARMQGGLYRGFWAGIWRTMGSTAIQFAVFDTIKETLMEEELD